MPAAVPVIGSKCRGLATSSFAAIKSQIIHTDSDNLVEFDSDSSSLETSFNLGQRLWGLQDQAIDCQNSRQESAHKFLITPAKNQDTDKGVPTQITKARHVDHNLGTRQKWENKTPMGSWCIC